MTVIQIDCRDYFVEVRRQVIRSSQAPRLVVVSFLPNLLAGEMLKVCIQAIQRFTPEPHVLWVVDNNSPAENLSWLLKWPNINLVLNRTEPLPPSCRGVKAQLAKRFRWMRSRHGLGSYANAVALEIAARLIDQRSKYVMTLHMDTMPCRTGWLSFLQSKITGKVAAAGVRMDKRPHRTPEGVLHILGCMVDFQVFQQLELNFFPQLPKYDVGDRVTVGLRKAGYHVYACHNTLWEPQLVQKIPLSSPLRDLRVDRSFDDDGNVIFLHLGRGVKRSVSLGNYNRGITLGEWIGFADTYLLT